MSGVPARLVRVARTDAFFVALLCAAVVALWLPTLSAPFTYDDRMEVVGNRTLREFSNWHAILTYNYARPLLIATYAANWSIGGLEPVGYHAVNIAIHAVNAILAWRLLTRILPAEIARFAAALWALHPMTTECVTYVSGRSDALVSMWMLAALSAWIDHVRSPTPRARNIAALTTLAAFLTKEIAFILPVLLLGAELFLVAGGKWRLVRWRRYLLFALVVVLGGAARLGVSGWPKPEVPRGYLAHLLTQAEVAAAYLRLWMLPWGQSLFHDHGASARWQGATALAGTIAAIGWALRRGGLAAFGLLIWLLPLAVPAMFILKESMAEHRAYLPGLAVCAALAWAWPRLVARVVRVDWRGVVSRSRWLLVAAAVILTARRNQEWLEEPLIWESATDVNPASAEAWYGYGDALRIAQRFPDAEVAYQRSLALEPNRPDTLVNLGIARAQRGDDAGAETAWESALRTKPGHCPALNNLAALEVRRSHVAAGVSGYQGTLQRCPDDPTALYNLGLLHRSSGRYDAASAYLRRYLEVAPGAPNVTEAAAVLRAMGGER